MIHGPISRRRALGVLASAGALALYGCGTSRPDALAFAEDFSGAELDAIMRESFVANVNTLTERQAQSWSESANAMMNLRFHPDWRERYVETAARREGEDIAELFGVGAHRLADRLVDVTDLAEELGEQNGGWISAAIDAAVVDGTWRAIPWSYTSHAINLRSDLLDQIDTPALETYDDLLEASTRLHDQDLPLAAFTMTNDGPNDSGNFAYSMMWSFGGQEVDPSGQRVVLDSQGTRDALEYYRELARVSDPRATWFDEGGNNDAFLGEQIALTQNASSIYWKALGEHPELAAIMDHTPYPAGPNGAHQLLEMNLLSIFEHSENVDAAKDWVRSVSQPEILVARANESLSFYTPPASGYLDDPDMPWNTDPKLLGFGPSEVIGHMAGWPGPATVEAALVYDNATIVDMFASVASGAETIDSAIVIASEALRQVYET